MGVYILTILLVGFGLAQCVKPDVNPGSDTTTYLGGPKQSRHEGEIELGKRLENPYSVSNMQVAEDSLVAKRECASGDIDVRSTHLYIKFMPQTHQEVTDIENDTGLELFDYPLDYEIKTKGIYYHDNSIPDTLPTFKYASVPADFQYSHVQWSVIEQLYLPEEDPLTRGRSAIGW